MHRIVAAGGREIAYELVRKKVKNLNLRAYPDGSVRVSAPRFVSAQAVDRFVSSRADFILRAQQTMPREENDPQMGLSYVLVWGEKVPVVSREGDPVMLQQGKGGRAEFRDGVLTVFCRSGDEEEIRCLIAQWQKDFSLAGMRRLTDSYYQKMREILPKEPVIKMRVMKSRWGGCQAQKAAITYNVRLLDYPIEAAEYVAVHELAHLAVPNHSKAFYQLVAAYLPDYKERAALLRGRAGLQP